MLRVLQVVGGLARGGIESVIMRFYRQVDRNQIQFDFVSHHPELNDYEDEIRNLGGRVFYMPMFNGENIISYIQKWERFFQEHPEYTIIHGRAWSTAGIYLRIAKQFGLYTIAHSHSVSARSGLSAVGRLTLKKVLPITADYYMACSKAAAAWLFGKRRMNRENFVILPNAIDIERFRYNDDLRTKIRTEYGVSNKFILGQVGSFDSNKNQVFSVDLLYKLRDVNPDTVLWLVGTGPDEGKVKAKVEQLGLQDAVVFWEGRDDVADLLQAMDIFLMPSHFESFGNAALEAQTAGLKVLCSDTIPDEVAVSDRIRFLPLQKTQQWLNEMKDLMDHKDMYDSLVGSKFDIKVAADWLQSFYLEKGQIR